ncbi:hypothetical protein [Microcoleus sp. K5-D4]|uniref:hypothetical protein n=1 Tax=Microcoleus sp. K5-D4 TaxID=2818801 RepID=UPI002FD251C2
MSAPLTPPVSHKPWIPFGRNACTDYNKGARDSCLAGSKDGVKMTDNPIGFAKATLLMCSRQAVGIRINPVQVCTSPRSLPASTGGWKQSP